jgi:hypothetical protein
MTRALFGISAFLSLASSVVFARLYVRPWLRSVNREQALAVLGEAEANTFWSSIARRVPPRRDHAVV